jgi:hypothetical protein
MAKEKSLVEEAIIQMKNLEEAVAENAKGILASTMKEEIKELVKESLSEQEEEDAEIETDVDMEEPEMEEPEMDDEEGDDMDTDNEDEDMMSMDSMDTIDLTGQSDEQVLRVFELMDPEDKIIVKKDNAGNINLKDNETNKEYMIVQEGDEEMFEMWDEENEEYEEMDEEDDSIESIVSKVFGNEDDEEMEFEDEEEMEFEDEEEMDFEEMMEEEDMDDMMEEEDMDDMMDSETIYEISFDDEDEMDFEEEDDFMMESKTKKSIKPKGVGIGKGPKKDIYSKNPNTSGGFQVVKKKANKTMGTGSAKKGFSYDAEKDNGQLEGEFKMKPKKVETKEAARTLGNGSNFRKGGLPKPRAHSKANTAIKESENLREMQILREKNDEYRKALNIFRNKLNEVAVFNSNLAYATRLFTEHSTSKQEKINILRRFDSVETIKESKNLYKTIKDELSTTASQPMNESIERVIEKAPSTGSAVNLIESKTYENPQFLRMKDLMGKLR